VWGACSACSTAGLTPPPPTPGPLRRYKAKKRAFTKYAKKYTDGKVRGSRRWRAAGGHLSLGSWVGRGATPMQQVGMGRAPGVAGARAALRQPGPQRWCAASRACRPPSSTSWRR
jgi:hypothetical protein